MKILLTGANGMVGRNVLEHPASSHHNILTPASKELNLLDFDATQHYLKKHQPDMIIHAAGKVGGIQANVAQPVEFLLHNLDMGRNIVIAARSTRVPKVLNLGSSCMYPRNQDDALRETQILCGELEPTNEGYALAKIVTARLCDYVSREERECSYKTIIPCNLYGRWDKFDPRFSHMVPAVIAKIDEAKKAGEAVVSIWGDGTAKREFLYAGDLADFIFYAIDKFDALPSMINVGMGIDYTIDEYYQTIAEIIGYTGEFHHDLDKPVGMARKLLDVEEMTAFGWRPAHTLYEGLQKTYSYYLEKTQGETLQGGHG